MLYKSAVHYCLSFAMLSDSPVDDVFITDSHLQRSLRVYRKRRMVVCANKQPSG
jgi:hypothetical protein